MKQKFCLLIVLSSFLTTAFSQSPFLSAWLRNSTSIKGRHYVSGNSAPIQDNVLANVQTVQYSSNWVYVTTNGIPSYITGPFLDGNPSLATTQNGAIFKFPLVPTQNTGTATATTAGNIGIFINGVALFDYRDGASWKSSSNAMAGGPLGGTGDGIWNRDAIVAEKGGFDCSKGHPAMGNYHHHQNPSAFNLDLTVISTVCNLYASDALYVINTAAHSPLIGFAYDGFPIYGAYGYKNADGTGGVTRIKSSYTLRNITVRTTYSNGSSVTAGPAVSATYPLGTFREDYQYTAPTVAQPDYLDDHNGRFCVTPEFPTGTYAYFCTVDANHNSAYPYCVGPTFYGNKVVTKTTSISEPTTTYTGPILASPKLSLDGYYNNNKVILNWYVPVSDNIQNFEVEASYDGINFDKKTTVKANNSSVYAFSENVQISSVIYYRIKYVDANGFIQYSRVLALYSNSKGGSLNVYPNPVANLCVLQLKDILKEDVTVNILNTSGQIVKQSRFYQGSTICYIETNNLMNGMYFVSFDDANTKRVFKIMVEH